MQAIRQHDGRSHLVTRVLALAVALLTAGAPVGGVALAQAAATAETASAPAGARAPETNRLQPVETAARAHSEATSRETSGQETLMAEDWDPPQQAAPPPEEAASEPAATPSSQPWYTAQDLEYLARLVHAEAEGEPYAGRVGVAAVVLNRVRHSQFPDSIAGVIFQPSAFEPVANGRIWEEPDGLSWDAAKAALDGYDPTGGAIFFYNPAKVGRHSWIWNVRVTGQIGEHVFGWR